MEKESEEDTLSISMVIIEMEKDMSRHAIELKKEKTPSDKEVILKILDWSADDGSAPD